MRVCANISYAIFIKSFVVYVENFTKGRLAVFLCLFSDAVSVSDYIASTKSF